MTKQKQIKLEFTPTNIFHKNMEALDDGYQFIINSGGARSSKTYSILQLLIVMCLSTPGMKVSIVRQSLPSMRKSVMYDFFNILNEWNLYSDQLHQKTENYYKFPNESMIEFFGVVDTQRVKGSKRDILYCNEAQELSKEEFMQLMMRTSKCCFIDRNPSEVSWIDNLLKDSKSILIKSTYKDNHFLGKAQIDYIDSLINVDPNYYKIYALGESPDGSLRIYNHFKRYTSIADPVIDIVYGLDFGMRDPTALVKCYKTQYEWYVEEIIYQTGWTQTDLLAELKMLVYDNKTIYCDSSRPDMIEDLRRNGYNAQPSNKAITAGIDSLRSQVINIHNDSSNIWKEYYGYYWKENSVGEQPIDLNNHALDAIRYAIHSSKQRGLFDPNAFFDKKVEIDIKYTQQKENSNGYDSNAFFG